MFILQHHGDRMMYPSAQFRKKIRCRSLKIQVWRLNKLITRHMVIHNPYLGLKLRTCSTSVPRDAPWQKAAAANSWSRCICTQEPEHLDEQKNWSVRHINCNTFPPFEMKDPFLLKVSKVCNENQNNSTPATTLNMIFSVVYGILCHYGNFLDDTSYE